MIGEHIDYNDGFVFPMAIPLFTIIVGAPNNDPNRICRVMSLEPSLGEKNYVEFGLNDLKPVEQTHRWANYIIGVITYFQGMHLKGFTFLSLLMFKYFFRKFILIIAFVSRMLSRYDNFV